MLHLISGEMRRQLARALVLAPLSALAGLSGDALAAGVDGYPERPITLVVAYAPGGGVDAVARTLGNALGKILKQSVIIDNRPGGGGTIGAATAQRAAADGYTLLLADPAYAVSPSLMARVPYNIEKDFKAVSTVTTSPLVLSVPVNSPFKNVNELEDLGRKNVNGFTYSSAGIGTSPHMSGEMFKLKTNGRFVHVPYRGSGPAMADLVAGNIDFSFSTMAAALPFIRDGKLRALAVTGPDRVPELKDAVPLANSLPGFDVRFWTTLMAASGTPPEIMRKLNEATRTALETEEVKAALRNVGEIPTHMSMDMSQSFVIGEWKKWAVVVKEANITTN